MTPARTPARVERAARRAARALLAVLPDDGPAGTYWNAGARTEMQAVAEDPAAFGTDVCFALHAAAGAAPDSARGRRAAQIARRAGRAIWAMCRELATS